MIGCPDCARMQRQMAAMEWKLRLQAAAQLELMTENDALREYQLARERRDAINARKRKPRVGR